MKKEFLFLSLLFTTCFVNGQKRTVFRDTLSILDRVSYYWKLDSLGENGYRLCKYSDVLAADLSKVTEEELVRKLGRPNRLFEHSQGNIYCYNIFDGRKIPREYSFSEEWLYVRFTFSNKSHYLIGAVLDGIDY